MPDNTVLNAGSGGDTIATDELTTLNGGAVTAVKVQRVKAGFGIDGVLSDVSDATPLPSKLTNGTTAAGITALGELFVALRDIVSATLTISAQDVGSATATGQNSQSIITGTPTAGSTAAITVSGDSSFAALVTGTWTGTLQFERSLDDGVTWTSVGAFSAGTNFIGQQITSNGAFHGNASSATNIRLRSIGAMTGSASVRLLAGAGTGTITVGNPIRLFDAVSGVQGTIKPASTPSVATDTSIVVALNPNTPLPSFPNDLTSSGSLAAAAAAVSIVGLAGAGTGSLTVTGTWAGTLVPEATLDGTTWFTISVASAGLSTTQTSISSNGNFVFSPAGYMGVRLRMSAFTSGSAVVLMRVGVGSGTNVLTAPLPGGANTIGAVNLNEQRASTLVVSTTGAVNTAVTATLPAAGAGLFHYITAIEVVKLYAVTGVASAAGNIITSTNLPGALAWTTEQIASAIGTAPRVIDYSPVTPLKVSAANTATTIVAPAQAQTIWRINVTYFTAA